MEGNIAEQRDYQALKAKSEAHKTSGVAGIDVSETKHFAAVPAPVGRANTPIRQWVCSCGQGEWLRHNRYPHWPGSCLSTSDKRPDSVDSVQTALLMHTCVHVPPKPVLGSRPSE